MFVIKTCDQRGTLVDYLLRKLSRITKFIIDRGVTVSVMLSGTHYCRSPLIKGGWRSHAKYQFQKYIAT